MLSKKQTSIILENLYSRWPENTVPKIKNLKSYEIEKNMKLLVHENNFRAVQINDLILPYLANNNLVEFFPFVLVDMGAVGHVCNGANVARPGIVKFGSFSKNKIVIVKDENHLKPLAVGTALYDSDIAISLSKGHVINTFHYVGDKFWKLSKELRV